MFKNPSPIMRKWKSRINLRNTFIEGCGRGVGGRNQICIIPIFSYQAVDFNLSILSPDEGKLMAAAKRIWKLWNKSVKLLGAGFDIDRIYREVFISLRQLNLGHLDLFVFFVVKFYLLVDGRRGQKWSASGVVGWVS